VFVRGKKDFASVQLQASARTASGTVEVGSAAPRNNDRVSWDVPTDATDLDLYLVDKSGDLLDHANLSGPGQAAPASEEISSADQAQLDLQSGESVEVEFKPFVKIGDEKEHEIVKAIVAFSNTAGGRLYLGIRNDGTPDGRAALTRAGGASPEDSAKLFERRLSELAREKVKPTPQISVERIDVSGEPVLLAWVSRGKDTPYSTHENDVYVRKGATNRKPDPRTELRALFPAEDHGVFVDAFGVPVTRFE
jgi:hypothetical protein